MDDTPVIAVQSGWRSAPTNLVARPTKSPFLESAAAMDEMFAQFGLIEKLPYDFPGPAGYFWLGADADRAP